QLLGDNPHVTAGGDEADPPVAELVHETAVYPVDRTTHVNPGEDPQEPAGGDLLHLRGGLGRRCQLARRGRAETRRGVAAVLGLSFGHERERHVSHYVIPEAARKTRGVDGTRQSS